MKFPFDFDRNKNLYLKEKRNISFEEIVEFLKREEILDDVAHPNKRKYPNQRIFILAIRDYIYVVPYVVDKKRRKIFLKTIYPNRVLTKKYLEGKQHEKTKR